MDNNICQYCNKKLRVIKEDSMYSSWNRLYHKKCWMLKRQDMCYEILMEDIITQKVHSTDSYSVVDRIGVS